jgi:hypothetical protein
MFRWPNARGRKASILEILEQPDRTGPSKHQIEGAGRAQLQTFKNAAITIADIELIHRIARISST